MIIGLYLNTNSSFGGVHQYALTLLRALEKIDKKNLVLDNYKNFFVRISQYKKNHQHQRNPQTIHHQHISNFIKENIFLLLVWIHVLPIIKFLYRTLNGVTYNKLNDRRLDIILFPVLTFEIILCDKPFIVCIHDLQHKQQQFPESVAKGQQKIRDYLVRYAVSHATHIITESNVGKQNLITLYSCNFKKLSSLPYIATPTLTNSVSPINIRKVMRKFHLEKISYVLYPANFWPHKNHFNLVKALKILALEKKNISLVLTGSSDVSYSTYDEVMKLIHDFHLSKQVSYKGYVTDIELSVLYKYAKALVMPTFYGPTNLPVVEAWNFGIPVVTSNLPDIKETTQHAALLADPNSPSDIAEKLSIALYDNSIREKLIRTGKKILQHWTLKEFSKELDLIFKRV